VAHDHVPQGANHYAYLLAITLAQRDLARPVLAIPGKVEEDTLTRYGVSSNQIFNYEGDAHILFRFLRLTDPSDLIYYNSCSTSMLRVIPHIPRHRLLLHSHEVPEHYLCRDEYPPDLVVSERIADLWAERGTKRPLVAPPFFTDEHLRAMLHEASHPAQEPLSSGTGEVRDPSRPVVVMCGSLSARKNFDLFARVAKQCPLINFMWIGGVNSPECFRLPNLFHVPQTTAPYKYMVLADLFLLTSSVDPCPFVVLESIALGLPVVAFSGSIFTDHRGHNLNYVELPGPLTEEKLAGACVQYCKKRSDGGLIAPCDTNHTDYLRRFYSLSPLLAQRLSSYSIPV